VHPLLQLLLNAAEGRFPPVDGGVTVMPALDRGRACSIGFTGHAVVATDLDPAEVRSREPDGFGGSLAPDFLRWLAGAGGGIGTIDVTLVARGQGGSGSPPPPRPDLADHPRVRYAQEIRSDVRVFGDERGVVTLASGLAGRPELSIEAAPDGQGHGAGRSLLRDALSLVPSGAPLFAAVAPGNARSLRAFLAVGFVPIGSEVLITPSRQGG
jgi:hypothetical protein